MCLSRRSLLQRWLCSSHPRPHRHRARDVLLVSRSPPSPAGVVTLRQRGGEHSANAERAFARRGRWRGRRKRLSSENGKGKGEGDGGGPADL